MHDFYDSARVGHWSRNNFLHLWWPIKLSEFVITYVVGVAVYKMNKTDVWIWTFCAASGAAVTTTLITFVCRCNIGVTINTKAALDVY